MPQHAKLSKKSKKSVGSARKTSGKTQKRYIRPQRQHNTAPICQMEQDFAARLPSDQRSKLSLVTPRSLSATKKKPKHKSRRGRRI